MHNRDEHLRIGRGIVNGMIGGILGWLLIGAAIMLALGMWR